MRSLAPLTAAPLPTRTRGWRHALLALCLGAFASGALAQTSVSNTASVTTPAGVTDPTPGNNSSTDTDSVTPLANVSISKTLDTAGPYFAGKSIQYTLVISNAGPSAATSINVSDTPSNLTINSVSGACVALPCTIASVASGASTSITVTATINAPGAFDNSATATSTVSDPDPSNNTDNTGNGGNVPVVVAADDAGTVASGASGGTAVASVLANDTVDGVAATTATVTLSQVSSTHANVTLDTGTGAVNVAAGTPAGTYTLVYQICEQGNPSNCDTASVTVTVGAAVIDAVNDAGSVASGATGGTAVANVLVNDTLDGAAATLATVTLSQVSTTHANVTLDTGTGAVSVAAGTAAGGYSLVYRICEQLNPTNCDQATVTVTVGAATIVANDDAGSVASGASGGVVVANVLANDTLDGAAATLATVTLSQVSTTHANVTLDTGTGAVTVAAGTPAGTYTLVYRICENLNPTNCDTGTVTVTVGAAVIDAVNDTGSVASGASGGTAVADVLVNDTLDGAAATLATVTLSQVSTTHANVTLDTGTGAINVAAGTPAGSYTLVYRICEQLNLTNCDQATVTVTVGTAVIVANDDAGGVAAGASGGVAVANVLANDTLDGAAATVATVTLSQVSTTHANVTLNAGTGAVSVAAGTAAGSYTLVYQICEQLNPTNCDSATVTVTVGAATIVAVDDAGTVSSGASGGTAVADVLVNDTLDGAAATLATVTLSQVSTTSPNVTLNAGTGAVSVAAGTAAGSYTLVYQICEQLNPTNCDSATVTVTVGAATIVAVDDAGTVSSGASGGTAVADVLVNDTLDGAAATLATVTLSQVSTTSPNVTLNAGTGAVSVAAGTAAGSYTLVYQICEQLNPTNCDSATVTVTVGAATIVAVDDAGTVSSGASGGTAVADVLVNDTLDGAAATLATVTLSQVSTTSPNVTLNAGTGAVSVAAGTAAGSYTLVYQICEQLNPTNCDSATVTVTVGAATIVAVDDAGTVSSGASGGTAVADVLVNDTLDGAAATLATVTLSQVSTTSPNVTLNAGTGAVSVAAGTAAGSYTLVYQICEQLNPTNCDSATVTVTVGAATIVAVDDAGTVSSGASGGTAVADVLVNDTLDGAAATLATVTLSQVSTTSPNVTLNAGTGAVSVAAGTAAGSYTLVYQICEQLNPTNCDSATVTVTVGAATIVAVDDAGTVSSGASGGTAVADVLVNDTLDGAAATLATVTLSQVSTTSPNVTLNAGTGAVSVAAGTAAGSYTLVYQICEQLNPTNCDSATVTVTVGAATIVAVDDAGTVSSGASGGTAVADVLVNDTLDGAAATLATVTLSQVSTTSPNVTLNAGTGAVSVAAGTAAGSYTLVYQICEQLNPTNCDSATVTVTVGAATIVAVDDAGTVSSGASGGTAVADVLVNDTLDGAAATLATVTLSQVSTTSPNVTLNAGTGAVSVAAGTAAGSYTLVYQICEQLNPTNCDSATVTVTVGAATIVAVDDAGTVSSGASGGTAVADVLVNDTLDGAAATLATVTLSQVSTTSPNVTLNAGTGAVSVAAGTAAGSYTLVYQICEQLNPTNCDSATVTVTVGAATIVAVDDAGTVSSGASGGTAVADVLVNDTLDGAAATLATVTLSQVSTTSPNVTLNAGTGAVSVAAGTAAGSYTLVYQICEQLNPTNCDSATVTVTVGAATIVAVDDAGTVSSGASGGTAVADVLVNDTLDGAAATLATVTLSQVSTTSPNVTLNAGTGAVSVAAGTAAGSYTLVYQICEQLNPTNCDSATVTVTVGAATIVAVDDAGTVSSGASGGTAVADVLVNDTLDGAAATLATVTLSQVSTTSPNVTLNAGTGAVSVAAGTAAGSYTLVYQICEQLNPTNCDSATVTVTVGAATIVAVDDAGTVSSGASGGTAVADVLVNDTLDGAAATLATVTLSQVSTTSPNVTLNAGTGAVSVAAGTAAGSYTLVYQICEQLNPTNCDSATVTVTVGAATIVAVDDAGTVSSGASGGTAVADVLVNDTLDGAAATLATVTLSQVSTTSPNVTLNAGTGAVSVAAGTAAGSYTLVYQICEQLNPTNCDSATVTVTVGAATIVAVDDAGTVSSGASGGTAVADVLVNDTLDGAAATLATVTLSQVSTTSPNVTLNAGTGAVSVAAGTAAGSYTLVYQICEQLNPTNCDSATVTVTVGAATIVAVDDAGTVSSGASGGTAVADVLVNDTLDGAAATLATVTLSQVSTTSPNVTLNAGTGAVSVAAGTAAGSYTLVYQICEQLNPTNCDSATVTVTVGAATIVAVDDAGTVSSGASGGTAVADVLVNDTLDGAAATLATVTLSQVSTTSPNVTLNAGTGAVSVAAGTAAGSYTLVYQICEQLNPTNCDSATVTVTVGAATIVAVDDAGTVSSGASGGTAVADVLVNDTLDGAAATLATVTLSQVSTTSPNVTLNAGTGAVSVAAGTAAGSYTLVYQICEQLNPTNCDSATVTVTVGAATIVAVDDAGTVSSGASGGTAVADVLVNDTLDGAAATLATVTLSQVSTTSPNVTLNAGTGAVSVAAGTAAGSYTLVYQICEQLNPTNCDSATVTVTVGAATIVAVDDAGTVSSGASGGTAVADVLVNDTLDGAAATLATVTLSQTSTSNPGITLDASTGGVNVAAGTASGTHTLVYQICETLNPANCDSATVTVTVGAAPIDAVDDSGSVASGATGGTAVANVLVNDTLNGAAATLANVTLTQTSTSNPGVTLDLAIGAVNVAAGTASGTYTLVYQICETLNPANCDSATVTVTVGAAPIDAVDDAGNVASGATGGTAVANVLVNDTLNGAAATLANVALTQASTSNPGVTLDTSTGAVNVAAGTASGTYTLVYQICETLNPANCDSATVTVTVGAATIDAVDDSGSVASGATGGTAVANILVNDALNGAVATLANVALTLTSTSNPGVTLDVATGAVNVAAGTASGTYTLVYQICETLNPANCDSATVTVTVGAATIDAVDDSGSVASGATGGTAVANVLVNDTINGVAATLANVALTQTSTSNPGVTLDVATGAVNVAAGTASGTYTLVYQICETLNPSNCDSATVTVTVGAATIDAVDDAGSVASGATGGTAVANVLVNDTLNGVAATLANVALTQTSTSNPGVTLDVATGAVNVAAGTASGTYTLVYQICETLNPANCDSATVTVSVGAATIDAVDDSGTVASGASGGTAVANVLVNDTLNGAGTTLANVTLTQTSTSNPGVTLDVATGAVNVAAGTASGTYTLVYQICEQLNPASCDSATVTVTVGASIIDAVDDVGTVVTGTNGGTAVANVLVNDTLDAVAATLANVTLTQTSSSHPNVTLDPATGAVNVAAGTAAGNYTLVYRICEILNPANCDSATVTVSVGAAPIDAVDDTGSVGSGPGTTIAVANVLANDTLDAAPATLATVTLAQVSTSDPNVTLDPSTGAVNVAANTTAGTYTLVYRICEILNPPNCDTATVTVTVTGGLADVYTQITIAPLGYVGEPIAGHVVFGNNGPDTADGVAYTMQLPPGLSGVTFSQPTGVPATMSFVYDPVTGLVTFSGLPTSLAAGQTFGMDYSFITPNMGTFEVSATIATTTNESSGSNNAVAASAIILIADRQVVLNKVADQAEASVGALIRYTIEVRNIGNLAVTGLELVDSPAPGLSLVEGSLIVHDVDNAGVLVPGNPIRITGIDVPVGGTATVSYLMRVGAATSNGLLVNTVQATLDDDPISDVSTSTVRLGSDPMLDQSRILGKVFDDQDGDGWQDDGERGIPGVRVATVEGWVAETDAQGRYHFEGLVLSDRERGQNFVVKVDAATLPAGTVFTTENPLLRRVTAGVPVRFDFGVKLPARPQSTPAPAAMLPVGVFTLDQGMFEADSESFKPEAEASLTRIAAAIEAARGGIVRITGYDALRGSDADKEALSLRRGRAAYERLAAKLGNEAKAGLQVEVEGADDGRGADR